MLDKIKSTGAKVMARYCDQVFHQLEIVAQSAGELISSIEESDWEVRPTDGKFSVGELIGHIAVLCEADLRIANGSSQKEMAAFYRSQTPTSTEQALLELKSSLEALKNFYLPLDEQQLHKEHSAYWGVSYSRFEWLLETLVHLTHHRAQLHAMAVHSLGKQPNIKLFE